MMKNRRALTATCVFIACLSASAAPLPAKTAARINLNYTPHQLDELRAIPSECYGFLAGNFAKPSPVAALVVAREGKPGCDVPPSTAAPTSVTFKVIPLKPVGLNLVRVDQDFGGSSSLRRYLVVSVVTRAVPVTLSALTTEKDLINRGLLPDTLTNDDAAWRFARTWAARL